MWNKYIGSILLLLGTCLGGAIVVLPVNNSALGFGYSSLALILVWLIMTYCSYLIVKVSEKFPIGSNFYTMSASLLGPLGNALTFISYLMLLYSLIGAYSEAGGGLVKQVLFFTNVNPVLAKALFVLFFGAIVVSSMLNLDRFNRLLIVAKLMLFFAIVSFGSFYVDMPKLAATQLHIDAEFILVICTSFGFGVILPSLRKYLNGDPKLSSIVLVGSTFALIIYLVWNFVITGVIGNSVLQSLTSASNAPEAVISKFSTSVHQIYLIQIFNIFTYICVLTSFLGISRSMFDFWQDSLAKYKFNILITSCITFLPPLIWVTVANKSYLSILSYAGIACVYLHILMPILLARKVLKFTLWQKALNYLVLVVSSLVIIKWIW